MTADLKARRVQRIGPTTLGADVGSPQKTSPFLLCSQPGEPVAAWIVLADEALLAVQHRRISRFPEILERDVELCKPRDNDCREPRMSMTVEGRILQIRN